MAVPDFIVHRRGDSVGIVVAEAGVAAGARLSGWIVDVDEDVALTALDDVPLGHKIALRDCAAGEAVVVYGHDVGRAVAPIQAGRLVHVHNLRTARW